jgi:histidine ammonia-lyase
MGLLTWIAVAIVILAIMGLGWQVFFSGVMKGAEKVLANPSVKNVTNEAKEFLATMTDNVTTGIGKELGTR